MKAKIKQCSKRKDTHSSKESESTKLNNYRDLTDVFSAHLVHTFKLASTTAHRYPFFLMILRRIRFAAQRMRYHDHLLKSKNPSLVSSHDWSWYSDLCLLRTFPRRREIKPMFSTKANILGLMRCNIATQELVFL